MSGVFSVFPVNTLRSGFWTTLLSPCTDGPVIDLTAILTRGITTLSIAVKIVVYRIFDIHNSIINRLPNFVVKIVLYDLVLTCTVFTIENLLAIL